MAGAAVALWVGRRQLPLAPILALLGAWLVTGHLLPPAGATLAWIAVPLAVLAIGQRSYPVVRRSARFGDISYGLYLWGFPVQQLLVWAVPSISVGTHVALSLLIVAPIALLSWHLVERPVLRAVRGRQRRVGEAASGYVEHASRVVGGNDPPSTQQPAS